MSTGGEHDTGFNGEIIPTERENQDDNNSRLVDYNVQPLDVSTLTDQYGVVNNGMPSNNDESLESGLSVPMGGTTSFSHGDAHTDRFTSYW